MIDFNNKDEVALIHKHLSTEIYVNCGISLGWIEVIRKYIEYLETKNKELTEKNERLRWISAHVCVGDVITSEQMEELRMARTEPGQHDDPVGPVGMVWVESFDEVKAETVQKMQERLEERIDQTIQVFDFQISECNAIRQALRGVKNDIYQIAKEMLEKNK